MPFAVPGFQQRLHRDQHFDQVTDQIRFPIYVLLEGRLFLDNADHIDNNDQFRGGIRIRF